MKYILIKTLFIFNAIIGLFQYKPIVPPELEYYLTSKEPSRYAIFKFDKTRAKYYGFDKNSKSTTLSKEELVKIEEIIGKRVKEYNRKAIDPIKQPGKYFKQLMPIINAHGEKEVWISCSCSVIKGYWKKNIGVANDGGKCYFQLKINLTKGTIYYFGVNGLV